MNHFWSQDVPYLSLLDEHHFFYIALMVSLLIAMIVQVKWIKIHAANIRMLILIFSIAQQLLLYSWYITETGFDISESLPLHISRISSILGIIYLITDNKAFLEVLFYFGLFAYGSFFYPSRVYPVYHAIGISFFINHAVTILLPIFAAIVYNWRPSLAGTLKSYGWFLLYFLFVYLLNPLIDGNYFYLKYRPFLSQLPDYAYVPIVLTATLFIFLLGYYLARGVEKAVLRIQNIDAFKSQ